jgi:hypothetical protein
MDKKYNYVYKTTNNINGKFYIGVHSTNKIKDGYIGCGIYRQSDAIHKSKKSRFLGFAHAVKKYGYENFTKEILYFFTNKKDAYVEEQKIVTKEFIEKRNNYNLKIGGKVAPDATGIKRTSKFKKDKSKQIMKYMDKLVKISAKDYIVVNLNTEEIFEVNNLAKFCRNHNLKADSLNAVISKRSVKTRDNWWACKKEEWTGKPVLRKRKKSKPIKGKLKHKDGRLVEFNNLREASEKTGADKSMIRKVLLGKYKQTKGWYNVCKDH